MSRVVWANEEVGTGSRNLLNPSSECIRHCNVIPGLPARHAHAHGNCADDNFRVQVGAKHSLTFAARGDEAKGPTFRTVRHDPDSLQAVHRTQIAASPKKALSDALGTGAVAPFPR
jgi:hypothetical protein